MVINTDMLTLRMKQLGLSLHDLSVYAEMSEEDMLDLLNNKREMMLGEAYLLCDYLKIPISDVARYFFHKSVAYLNRGESY